MGRELSNRRRRGAFHQYSVGAGCGDDLGIGRRGRARNAASRCCRGSRSASRVPSFRRWSPISMMKCDGAAGVVEAEEQALVQELVAHATVEGFDITVLHRLARRDVGIAARHSRVTSSTMLSTRKRRPQAAGEPVMDEIQRPARIRLCLDQDRRPRADCSPSLPGACAPSDLPRDRDGRYG